MADEAKSVQKTMQMGLGEAIQRLMQVEHLRTRGLHSVPEDAKKERDLIVEALNTHKLDLGFDCDADGVPDSVAIFAKSVETACCRLVPADTSRKSKGSSRRKKSTSEES